MKHKEELFRADYKPDDKIRVRKDNQEGRVVRLSSAGVVEYIHAEVNGIILTFRDFQIDKIAVLTRSC